MDDERINDREGGAIPEPAQASDPLYILASQAGYKLENDPERRVFTCDGQPIASDQELFYSTLNGEARKLLKDKIDFDRTQGTLESPMPFNSDARFYFAFTRDDLKVYGCLFPPFGSGKSLSLDDVMGIIRQNGIVYGLCSDTIAKIAGENRYFVIFPIAQGEPPVDGIDGSREEFFPRSRKLHDFDENDDVVDFKNLEIVQKIEKGTVIARITPPVPAVDGKSVKGVPVNGKPGKVPSVPRGSNTTYNEQTHELTAECDGSLVFLSGSFSVNKIFDLSGNVDNSTGNIDMIGDVIVRGNVLEGFTIKATGNVTVYGIAEGASIIAGGDISLKHGMNGNMKGMIEAKGSVEAKYLENCTVKAHGDVSASSIINCRTTADNVMVTGKPGVIIGGETSAYHEINALYVGNDSATLTQLSVGVDADSLLRVRQLQKDVEHLRLAIEESQRNIKYLEGREQLTEEYANLLKNLKYRVSADKIRLMRNENELKTLVSQQKGANSSILVRQLFPPVKVDIVDARTIIRDTRRMVRIYKFEDKIEIGNL